MSPKKKRRSLAQVPAEVGVGLDERFQGATLLRRAFNKVFPNHWSFLLGEIALYSFVILLLTGTFLALFFDPSMTEVEYNGSYTPLRGIEMSQAFNTSLHLSFDVRGGLFLRQMHHWSALLFMASIVVHMFRIFFTGAFRKPRETNWAIGVILFLLGFFEGFLGYGLPDDALSGTGLRIATAIVLSIPVIGSWTYISLFGSEFPGTEIIPRLYITHVFLIPALLAGLIGLHLVLMVKQKHTQVQTRRATDHNVVGYRMVPNFAFKTTAFFLLIFGVTALLAGLVQINPIWLFGPYKGEVVSAASQPDWYVMFLDGSTRLMPDWDLRIGPYTVPAMFWPTVVLPGILVTLAIFYPQIDRRIYKDQAAHHLMQRPRDAPARAALGMMAVSFWVWLTISGANDVVAEKFDISLNATTWAGRVGLFIVPPIAYWVTYRICLGLQQHDREVLAHGVETGIIKRLPDGRFIEVHQPLGDGHLEYTGLAVPKKMNRVGALGPAIRGFFFPIEKSAAPPPATTPVSPADAPRELEEAPPRH
jgi:quinol---cytochrome-c reductase cytochrome b subunit